MSVLGPDLSETGARLQGRDLPSPRERLLVNFGQTGVFATVAWTGSDQCGIVFDNPLDSRGVEQLRAEADWASVMGLA